ncbi:hypothetical protein DXG01_002800 [Tephrocybe rancida]|nr:hypothetical protein DXG01_002800 [Tephrocybe rancida]
MIECDASRLAGLRSIALVNSSGTLLDQTQLPHSTYPAIPKEPVMTKVRELTVDATSLVSTSNENTPSFDASALRTLVLARLSAHTEEAVHSIHRLFNFTFGQRLETLTCVSLDTRAFQIFLAMTSAGPIFPHMRSLFLKDVNVGDVSYRFLQAFPAVIAFKIEDARPHSIMTYLLARDIMPSLNYVHINGRTIPRPRALAVFELVNKLACGNLVKQGLASGILLELLDSKFVDELSRNDLFVKLPRGKLIDKVPSLEACIFITNDN